jgi:hypothetical protein
MREKRRVTLRGENMVVVVVGKKKVERERERGEQDIWVLLFT